MSKMLESYSISYNGKSGKNNNYKLKFKVPNDVEVTFNEVNGINEVTLRYASKPQQENHDKNYSVTGKLSIQFFQYQTSELSKTDGGDEPIKKPVIIIDGGN